MELLISDDKILMSFNGLALFFILMLSLMFSIFYYNQYVT